MNRPVADHAFVEGLDARLGRKQANGDAWSLELRRRAQERFVEFGLPGSDDESWRHLPLKALTQHAWPLLDAPGSIDRSALDTFAIPGLDALRLVLLDGFLVPELSDLGELPTGLEVFELHEALSAQRELLEPLLSRDGGEGATSFEALNAAWCQSGVVVRAQAKAEIDRPLHILHVSTHSGQPSITHPRIVLRAERSARFSVVEDHVCLDGSEAFVNLAVGISLAENAALRHVKLVRTGPQHIHFASTRSEQARDSRLFSVAVTLDGKLVRQDLRVRLQGSGSEATLNGLVVLDAEQVVDNHSWVHHDTPHTRSNQHYRNVLDGTSRAVFAGRVVVAEGASGTDAQQHNANLLLSDTAQVNVLPQLEIYNDDVKASHGATLGQLDRDGLFYLRSRGIDEEAARGLLTFAFANTVVETIDLAPVREFLRRQIFEHLPQVNLSEELV